MAQDTRICIAYKIEGIGGGFKNLTVDAEAFRKLMEATVSEADKLKKSFMDFSTISNGFKNTGVAVTELSGALSQFAGEHMDFDKAMKAANTMAGKDSTGFRKLKDEISELAKQLPIARDELANGLYQVISNGVPESDWLEYLYTSARSASSSHHSFHVGKPILLIRRLVLPTAAMTSRMPLAMNNTVPISTNVLYAIRSSK